MRNAYNYSKNECGMQNHSNAEGSEKSPATREKAADEGRIQYN